MDFFPDQEGHGRLLEFKSAGLERNIDSQLFGALAFHSSRRKNNNNLVEKIVKNTLC